MARIFLPRNPLSSIVVDFYPEVNTSATLLVLPPFRNRFHVKQISDFFSGISSEGIFHLCARIAFLYKIEAFGQNIRQIV